MDAFAKQIEGDLPQKPTDENEQPIEYWLRSLKDTGYTYDTPIWNDPQ